MSINPAPETPLSVTTMGLWAQTCQHARNLFQSIMASNNFHPAAEFVVPRQFHHKLLLPSHARLRIFRQLSISAPPELWPRAFFLISSTIFADFRSSQRSRDSAATCRRKASQKITHDADRLLRSPFFRSFRVHIESGKGEKEDRPYDRHFLRAAIPEHGGGVSPCRSHGEHERHLQQPSPEARPVIPASILEKGAAGHGVSIGQREAAVFCPGDS